jgi:hypothetical protein
VALRAGAMAIAGSQFISTGLKTHLEKYCSDFIGIPKGDCSFPRGPFAPKQGAINCS